MPAPPTNNTFTDIFTTSNGFGPSSMVSLLTSSFFSYFSGPNGSGAQPYNNWGQGEASGDNRIYGTTAKTTNLKVSDFSDKWYFYQQLIQSVQLDITNNAPTPTTPPDPPDAYDFNISLTLSDSSVTYPYLSDNSIITPSGFSTKDIITTYPPDTVPLINTYYWTVDIFTAPTYPGIAGTVPVDININGSTYVSGVTLNNGANSFDFNTYGTAVVTLDQPSTGLTGSFFEIRIN